MKKITLLNKEERVIFHDKLINLPLKEKVIIDKSIFYYNDPAPCYIHRSSIVKKLLYKFQVSLEEQLLEGKRELMWSDIPLENREFIDLDNIVHKVIIKDYNS
ncbi:MAG: hypothetical protein GX370_05680 [Clostridia bacterium]|nr:hypothetical protein [Clostridia bacterium]